MAICLKVSSSIDFPPGSHWIGLLYPTSNPRVTDVMTQNWILKVTYVLTFPGNRCDDIWHLINKSTSQLEKEIFGNFLKEEQKHEQKLMQVYAEMKEKYGLK
jgi:hypothetical protein